MLTAVSYQGLGFVGIAVVTDDGETLGVAFSLLNAGKLATALADGKRVRFVPVHSGAWHYDESHSITPL
jgi:hypothetical protein